MAYGKTPAGKAKPSNYPFGQTGGTEMTASNKTKMSSKQLKQWANLKPKSNKK
jgi:hypothetical protein